MTAAARIVTFATCAPPPRLRMVRFLNRRGGLVGIGLRFGAGPLRVYIPLTGGRRRRRRRRKSKYWTHNGCTIHHRTQDAANRCKVGRATSYTPVASPPKTKATPKQQIAVVVFVLAVGSGLYAIGVHGTTSSRTESVSRATFTGSGGWPLTVDTGILSCPHGTVLFTAAGVTYAQFPITGDGHANIDPITASDPVFTQVKMSVFSLFEEGQALC